MSKITFSVNMYDHDGDTVDEGIFLHFGDVSVKVADDLEGYDDFLFQVKKMKKEIKDNYYPLVVDLSDDEGKNLSREEAIELIRSFKESCHNRCGDLEVLADKLGFNKRQ